MNKPNLYLSLICLIVLCFPWIGAHGQNADGDLNFLQVYTPQSASLGSQALTPVSMYTGRPSVDIPIYTIDHYGLQIPISLNYNANGLIPNKAPGVVGLNWSLVAGGVITRTVNTVPDERSASGGWSVENMKGFDSYRSSSTTYSNDDVKYLQNGIIGASPNYWGLDYELSPDLFTFNFGGHSGKFMWGLDKQIHVQSDEQLDVELQLGTSSGTVTDFYTGKIIITTDDGTRYEFGGSTPSVEYSYYHDPGATDGPEIVNAWYLSKITTPEGNQVNFIYEGNGSAGQSPPYSSGGSPFTYIPLVASSATQVVKSAYLSRIECRNNSNVLTQSVSFTNGVQQYGFGGYNDFKNEHLNQVQVKNQAGSVLKTINLSYTEFTNAETLLNSVQETGKEPYTFDYWDSNSLGSISAVSPADYWGFYTTRSRTRPPDPILRDANLEMQDSLSYGWITDLSAARIGMLHFMNSPLKSQTELQYEVQDCGYSYSLYGMDDTFKPSDFSRQGGGLRIRQVTVNDAAGTVTTRQYKYVENYIPGGSGFHRSGIMAVRPNFYRLDASKVIDLMRVDGEPPVTYSEVAEISPGNGYTIYKYTSKDYMDRKFASTAQPYKLVLGGSTSYTPFAIVNFYRKRSSAALERGKPSLVTQYTESGVRVSSTAYTYNTDPSRYDNRVSAVFFPNVQNPIPLYFIGTGINYLVTTYDTYFFSTKLKKEEYTQYNAAGSSAILSKTTWYNYNSRNQLAEKISSRSDGLMEKDKYRYVWDYNPAVNDVLKQMKDAHILSPAVEQQTLKYNSGWTNGRLTGGELRSYQRWGSSNLIFRPLELKRLNITAPGSSDTTMSTGSQSYQSAYNSLPPAAVYQAYDSEGNLQQARSPAGSPSRAQIWGYNQQYPVADVRNASSAYTTLSGGSAFSLASIANGANTGSVTFTTYGSNTVTLTINAVIGSMYNLTYSLSGPGYSQSGTLCASRTSEPCIAPETVSFTNVPAGTYTLSLNSSFPSVPGRGVNVSYTGLVSTAVQAEFYQENFEEMGGNTSTAHTGHQGHTGSFTPAFTAPSGRTYVLSYWSWNGSSWTYSGELAYTGQTLSGTIDDVRVYPSDAQMSTYTYDPLVGLTSQVDDKGQTTYYQYDANQRLQQVKDQEGNILKQYDYNYKH